jgi:hypothetical protein
VPYLFGNPIENIYDWGRMFATYFPLARSVYVGLLPLVLVPIAVVGSKDKRAYFFTGVFVVSLLFSLGRYTPLYKLAYGAIPMFAMFRYPVKFFFAATFALSILSGFGLQYMLFKSGKAESESEDTATRFTGRFFTIVLAASIVWFILAVCDRFVFGISDGLFLRVSSADASMTARFIPFIKQQMLHASIMFLILGAGLSAWQRGMLSRRLIGILAVAFVVIDIMPTNYRAMDTIPESFYMPPPIDSVLRIDRQPFRLYRTPLDLEQNIEDLGINTPGDYYMWNRGLLSPNFGTLFGYSYTDGYESANLLWHNAFVNFVETSPPLIRLRLLGLLNVKYIFSSRPVRHPDLILKSSPADNVFLYENTRCLDRAYFVPVSVVAANEAVALQFLASDKFDPRQMVVLVDKGGPGSMSPQYRPGEFEVPMPPDSRYGTMDVPPESMSQNEQPAPKPPNPVETLSYSPNSATLTVDAPSDGYVVLCDAYYPRWRVYVNGKEERLLRANTTVRAVAVSAGENSIKFIYDNSAFRKASITSLVALILCLAAIALDIFLGIRRTQQRS